MSGTDTTVDMPEVSWTALGAAWTRASEGDRPDPLFTDELARQFVAAAGTQAPFVTAVRRAADPAAGTDPLANPFTAMGDYVAIRTRFLDDYLRQAADAGCRQLVLLAAGLDSRAFRLDWPAGTRLFELDMPELMAFKEDVVRGRSARTACERVVVPADLRDDWGAALRGSGLDVNRPTLWLAEGLLHYLTPTENQRLLDGVSDLSAAGSWLATDHIEADLMNGPKLSPVAAATGLTYDRLVQGGPGDDPVRWLRRAGWDASPTGVADCARRYRRPVPPILDPAVPGSVPGGAVFVTARREGGVS